MVHRIAPGRSASVVPAAASGRDHDEVSILLVDRDADRCSSLAESLRRLGGFAITQVPSASAAFDEGCQKPFDLVLASLELASGDGLAVSRWFSTRGINPALVMLIGRRQLQPEEIVQALDAGASDVLDGRCEPSELMARVRAMARLRARFRSLALDAATDPLTGLWNRYHLDSRAPELTASATRSTRPISCLAIDLDHFKDVNDSFGHEAGDRVLCEVARRIRTSVRESDLAFRVGGEEFVVLLPDTPLAAAHTLGQRIREAVNVDPFHVDCLNGRHQSLALTLSVGVSEWIPGTLLEASLRDADHALIRAKQLGRDRCEVSNPSGDTSTAAALPAASPRVRRSRSSSSKRTGS